MCGSSAECVLLLECDTFSNSADTLNSHRCCVSLNIHERAVGEKRDIITFPFRHFNTVFCMFLLGAHAHAALVAGCKNGKVLSTFFVLHK